MVPWIQVNSNLITHPKISDLADELNITSKDASPNAVAAGLMVSLWLWAAQNVPDGNLGNCSNRAISEAAQYRKKPDAFVDALIKVRLLDPDKKIHDWDEHASLLMDSVERTKENNAKRQKRYRERKQLKETKTEHVTEEKSYVMRNVTRNVTNDESNAPTIPNLTIPNLTLPNNHNNTARNNTVDYDGVTAEEAPAKSVGPYFTEFWNLYPTGKGGNREEAWKAWGEKARTSNDASQIIEGLKAWIVSDCWADENGRYIPGAAKFIREERWLAAPDGIPNKEDGNCCAYPETMEYLKKLMAGENFNGESKNDGNG